MENARQCVCVWKKILLLKVEMIYCLLSFFLSLSLFLVFLTLVAPQPATER
jgi:hypothetical protein